MKINYIKIKKIIGFLFSAEYMVSSKCMNINTTVCRK